MVQLSGLLCAGKEYVFCAIDIWFLICTRFPSTSLFPCQCYSINTLFGSLEVEGNAGLPGGWKGETLKISKIKALLEMGKTG